MVNKILIILSLLLAVGCKPWQERFSEQEYSEDESDISNSEILYFEIGGEKQKVKKLDYDDNKTLRKETFFRDRKTHKVKLYNEFGNLVKEESYNKGDELDGHRVIYYPDGNVKEEYDFVDGLYDGKFNSYYENGSLRTDLEYSAGDLMGTCSWYYPSGNLMIIKDFSSGVNYKIEFHENGEKKAEGPFGSGDLFNANVGRWVFYDKQGRVTLEMDY